MAAHDVIIRPVVTEKSMRDVAMSKYVFAVAKQATKTEIKNAIYKTFNVTVVSVATSIVKGKKKRAGAKRIEVEQSVWKKATVTLKKVKRSVFLNLEVRKNRNKVRHLDPD